MINVDAPVLDQPDTQPDTAPLLPDAYSAVLAQAVMPTSVAAFRIAPTALLPAVGRGALR